MFCKTNGFWIETSLSLNLIFQNDTTNQQIHYNTYSKFSKSNSTFLRFSGKIAIFSNNTLLAFHPETAKPRAKKSTSQKTPHLRFKTCPGWMEVSRSNWIISPGIGMKYLSCHHLGIIHLISTRWRISFSKIHCFCWKILKDHEPYEGGTPTSHKWS